MSSQDAVIAVREERTRIGGVEVAKKTVIAATDEGVIAFEINTVQATDGGYGNNNPRLGYPGYPGYPQQQALPSYPQQAVYLPPSPTVVVDPPERDCHYHCFACDNPYEWYDLRGKGICWVLLLLLFYLILAAILIPIFLLYCLCRCFSIFNNDD